MRATILHSVGMRTDKGSLLELGLVVLGAAFVVVLFLRSYEEVATPFVLDLATQSEDVTEAWSGIYVQDQKIGYAVQRTAPRKDGGTLMQERTHLRLMLLGSPNDLTLANDVRLGADGRVERLQSQVKTTVQGLPVTLRAEGRAKNGGMELDLFQGGSKLSTLQLDDVPATPVTLYRGILKNDVTVGKRVAVPFFSPLSLGRAEAVVEIKGRQMATTPEGEQVEAWRLAVSYSGQTLEALVAPDGRRLLERELDGGLGMEVRLQTREDALHEGWPADAADAVDLIALSSIPVDRKLPSGGRDLKRLVLDVQGPAAADELLARYHGDSWDLEARHLTIEVPDWPTESYPLPSNERALQPWTRPTTFAPSDHPSIRREAGKIVGDELMAHDAARRLSGWVHQNIRKVPVAGVPNALEILQSRRGDCNEHTTLFTALARALGLPTRVAAGIVYSESIFEDGAFYYHAWPEVWTGAAWLPVDPTFGQVPADATHIKLVEGELDKQMELMGVIGRLSLRVVDASSP